MCYATNNTPIEVCTIGDLTPGQRFWEPALQTNMLVAEGNLLVRLDNGEVTCTLDWVESIGKYRKDIKLADRGDGKLYASHRLNAAPTPPPVDADEAIVEQLCDSDGNVISQKIDGKWVDTQ